MIEDEDIFDPDGDFSVEFEPLTRRRMIVIKVMEDGDVHAEDNEGQMIIIRSDGTVSSFLEGDENWVHGSLTESGGGRYWEGSEWDTIGFHLGMTAGKNMERARNGGTTN